MVALGRPPIETPFLDQRTKRVSGPWVRWLNQIYDRTGGEAGTTGFTGPSSATDNAIARFNGSGGSTVQNSVVTVADSGNIGVPALATVDGRDVSVDGTSLDTHIADTDNPHSVAVGQLINALKAFQVTIGQADLAAAAQKIILDAAAGETWKVREIQLSGDGTNFSGGGGDRLLSITDGTSTWSVIPAATLQSLAAARWGDAGVPFPATAGHMMAASASGADIVAQYSGGTADYTAGSLTLVLIAERTA